MQCAESLRVEAYFDQELDAVSSAAVERHIEHCPECRTLLEELGRLRADIRRDVPLAGAPPALRARIARVLGQESSAARRAQLPAWRSRAFWLGAGGGLGAALAAGIGFLALSAGSSGALLDELLGAHVRSLMPAHLTDVVSTDQHTVKPWFAGHADVSPVVADFAARGYRLIGGRADYFDHQRAAVVVYEHGAHIINVFAWVAGRASLPAAATRSGYHLLLWRSGDLEYCAVSDAGWDELQGLAQLLRDLGARDVPRAPPAP
jgi:anti-sigma factor RsiW